MPICKNDPTKKYKGTEPSPKGLGYCAHAQEVDKIRKGLDGNRWIVTTNKNGIKRWIKYKSTEPSPKGLGFCAHTQEVGKIRKGLDGNKWIVTTNKNGIKRWIKYKK